MKTFLDVVVRRSEWMRGTGNGYLLSHGLKCCLGFACLAAGLQEHEIVGVGTPEDVFRSYSAEVAQRLSKFVRFKRDRDIGESAYTAFDKAFIQRLVAANDDKGPSDDVREKTIARIGRTHGINFSFVD